MRIAITRGLFAVIDDDDFRLVCTRRWQAKSADSSFDQYYAQNASRYGTVFMHRIIMNAPKGAVVDHINHDTLDNRKSNLRITSWSGNAANSRVRLASSGFRGVHWNYTNWRAVITFEGRVFRRSGYATARDAAVAYDDMARKFHGEFAVLNFPALVEAA